MVASALYCTGCAEGLDMAAWIFFNGTIPIKSNYWRGIVWTTSVNVFNLIICLVGGKAFGKMVVGLLFAVFVTYAAVFYSFLGDYSSLM